MTVSPAVAAEIRRLYHAEHWKRGTIAEQLGVHFDAVVRVLGSFGPKAGTPRPDARVLEPVRSGRRRNSRPVSEARRDAHLRHDPRARIHRQPQDASTLRPRRAARAEERGVPSRRELAGASKRRSIGRMSDRSPSRADVGRSGRS